MRGKNIDVDFVISFIEECANNNKITPSDICEEAISRMDLIEEQIKLRNKLSDVLNHFGYKRKSDFIKNQISFDKINKNVCKDIFSIIKFYPVKIDSVLPLFDKFNNKQDLIFTFKQLLEADILSRTPENTIEKGSLYSKFNV